MNNKWIPDLEDFRFIQTAVVHGAAQKCNGGRYPAIFVRIDTSEALSWINSIVFRQRPAASSLIISYRSGSYILFH